ncbi:ABC transporter ATP-binding protein [Cytophagales bacterium RKSG123]|nr:ABC transporter ATP-binding protein [Xanthovirga aplysinae]
MLQFVNFRKSYGNVEVLKIENMLIEPSIYWVKGVNGSGKTTLLKAIAGLIWFEGDIILTGKASIKKQAVVYRRRVNFAEAEPIFPDFLTGREMINVFASAKGAFEGQKQFYIESMKIQSYMEQPLGTYSSGMLKKLSLVLAFLGNPKLILLDEPLITLDVESLEILYSWIAEKCKKDGTSFMLSSHQPLNYDVLPTARELLVEKQTLNFKI